MGGKALCQKGEALCRKGDALRRKCLSPKLDLSAPVFAGVLKGLAGEATGLCPEKSDCTSAHLCCGFELSASTSFLSHWFEPGRASPRIRRGDCSITVVPAHCSADYVAIIAVQSWRSQRPEGHNGRQPSGSSSI